MKFIVGILAFMSMINHGCILPGLGTNHFSPILLPTRKSGTIRHLENGGNQNFTEAFVTLIVTMLRVQ